MLNVCLHFLEFLLRPDLSLSNVPQHRILVPFPKVTLCVKNDLTILVHLSIVREFFFKVNDPTGLRRVPVKIRLRTSAGSPVVTVVFHLQQ